MAFCPNCGKPLETGDRFCPGCGRAAEPSATPRTPVPPVQPSTPSPQPSPSVPAPRSGPGKKIALIAGAGCLTLLLGVTALVVLSMLLTGGATDAAKAHLQKLTRGEVSAAYEEASSALKEQITVDAYIALVNQRPQLTRTRSISIPERSVENGVADVTAQLTDESGVVRAVPMRLREEQGTWRVIAVDLSAFPSEGPPKPAPEKPAATTRGEPRVGSVVIGSGRDAKDALLNPGKPVPSATTETLSADIALIDHPLGGSVQVWIEHLASGRKTAPISATINGEGSGNLPYDLHLTGEKLQPGKYRMVILLGEDKRFTKEFQVR